MTDDASRGVHVELYVRSLAPRSAVDVQSSVLETLDSLVDRDRLREFTVHVTGQQLPATPAAATTELGEYLLNRIAVFSAWAQRNDCSLAPLYERRTVSSSLTGTNREVITLPVMSLAEYDGPALRFVSPCRVDGDVVTIEDRLEELKRGVSHETTHLPDARADPPEQEFLQVR